VNLIVARNKTLSCLASVHEKLGMPLVHAQETAGTIAPWIQPWQATIIEVHCRCTRELVVSEATTIFRGEAVISFVSMRTWEQH